MKLIFDEKDLYIGFLLEKDDTGNSIKEKAIEEGFRKQGKRHITVLGGSTKKLLKNILDYLPEEERKSTLDEIKSIINGLKWNFTPKEIYRIQKQGYFGDSDILENRQSYINMVNMPDMEVFYKKLNRLLKTNLPIQVPHITLFTKGERENPEYYGIPVPSIEEFNSMNPNPSKENP